LANTSAPVTLQLFDSSYANLEDRAADIFMAGYGAVWMPPPGRADLSNFSVGYDVYDRFDLGSPGNATLYGTETGMKTAVDLIHRLGGNYIVDYIANHAGFSDLGTSGFAAAGGYPGLAITLPGDIDGDFHSSFDSGDLNGRLAGLVDIAQEKNHQLIRNPVDAGATNNIPAGTTPAFGRLANVPDPNNARFYPDQSQTPIMLFDPVTNESNIPVYPFNNTNPLAGDAVAENATGYLMRNAQWLVQTMGVDGFRIDAAKHVNGFFFDFFDRAVYRSSNRYQLDGSQHQIYAFSEVFDGSKSYQQSFIKKTINPNDPGRIGGNRDVLDFPLFFALRDNLTSNGFTNDFRNVVNASQDSQDDGFANNGSQGFSFVNSHDENGPHLSNVAHAFTLLRPGSSVVYMNAEEFGTNRDFPKDGRGDALGGTFGNTLTSLVDIRNTHGRGNYIERFLEKELLVFEREDSMLALLSNRTDGGFDSRTISTSFAPGTPLIELTGNASASDFDPFNDFPELVIVNGDGTANVRIPRNTSPGGANTHNRGYLVYGLATPQGSLSLSNVASTIAAETADSSTNGTARLTSIDVITGNSFDLTLATTPVNLLGFHRDRPADGDEALFKIDEGYDLNGSGQVDYRTPGGVSYGFEQFTGTHSPGYLDAEGDGLYQQTISTTGLSEGTHFVTVRAFRHREPGEGEAVYKDFRKAIYVDRLPANSTVSSFSPTVAGVNENRRATIRSVDKTANNVHVLLDVGAAKTDQEVIAMLGAGTQAAQIDRDLFTRDMSGLTSGNHTLTVVSYEQSGRASVQRFAGQAVSSVFGAGLGDLDADGDVDSTDIGLFETVLLSNNQQFNAAADLNADGLVNNSDVILLQARLGEVSANGETLGAYNALFGVAPGGYSSHEGSSASLTFTQPAVATPGVSVSWDLNNDGTFGDATGASPTVAWATLNTLGITDNGNRTIVVQATDGTNIATFNSTLSIANLAPTANHGGPYSVSEDASLVLDATDSTDPAGSTADPLTYEWDFDGDGVFAETGVDAQRGDETGDTPAFGIGGTQGETVVTISLRVRDDDGGLSPTVSTTVTITAVNDAPVLNNTGVPFLAAIDEDNITNVGTTIPALLGSIAPLAMITDFDPNPTSGIAIFGADQSQGVFEFSTNDGSSWTALGIVSASNARLLANSTTTRLRFVPSLNFNGTLDPVIDFAAWDQTTGADGDVAVISLRGGTTAFSQNVETASIVINAVNDAPTMSGIDNQTVAEEQPTDSLSFTVDDVETAAADLTVVGSSSNTTLVPNDNIVITGSGASRSVVVTPASNQFGSATITLTVDDGARTSTTSFVLTVTGINDAPTISTIDDLSTDEDTATSGISFTVGDLETAAAALTVSGSSSNTTLVPNGNIAISGSGASRSVVVTPVANLSGSATITLTVSDGDSTATESFLLTVNAINDAPTISAIDDQTVAQNVASNALGFSLSDAETAVADLTVTGSSSNAALVPNGNIVISGSGASRSVVVTPVPDQSGTATITLTVSDGALTSTETFTLTVNGTPTISVIDDQTIDEDTATDALAFTVSDPESAASSLSVSGSSSNTTLVPNGNIVISGSGSSRSVVVTPAANQFGSATITLTVSDSTTAATESFTLLVSAENDAPTISAIADQTVVHGTASDSLSFTVDDIETAAADLTVTGTSSNEALVSNSNIVISGSGASRSVVITPAANQSGSATITLTVSDGELSSTETFLVTIDGPPTISVIDDQTIDEDSATGSLSFTISDDISAAADLTVSGSSSNTTLVPTTNIVLSGSDANRSVIVTPVANQFGSATITLTVIDGSSTATETFTLTVNAVNDAPTISTINDQTTAEDTATNAINFMIGDLETATDALEFERGSSNTTLVPIGNIAISGSGANRSLVVTPAANQSGTATITISVSDGSGTTSESFVLTVDAVNDAPTISTIDDQSINEDGATGSLSFTIGDVDTATTELTVTGSSSNTTLIPNANIVVSGNGVNRSVVVTPAAHQHGSATITLTVNDGTGTATETFGMNVAGIPDGISVTDSITVINTQAMNGLVVTRHPLDGDEITFVKVTEITGGNLFRSNGTTPINNGDFVSYSDANVGLRFTPTTNGSGHFTVQAATAANDAALGGTTATATIQVRAPLSFAVTPDGVASTFGLRRNGSNIEVVNVSNSVVASRAAALTTQVQITGADGEADLLIVEFSGGDPRAEGLSFNAGTGSGDALRFAGSLNASDFHVTGTSIGAGTITLTAGNANTTFSGIEELSVVVTSLATATINIADGLNHTTDLVDAGSGQVSIAMPGLFNVITIKPTTALTLNGDDVAADVLRVLSVPSSFAASLTVNGRGGNDTLTAASFAKTVTFDGGLGNDTLIGGSGADSLSGGDGDDELTGGRGVDVLDGGNGTADRLREQDDLNFVLTSSLTRSGVGFTTETELLAGFETATLIGGVSSNSINASGWTGALGVILDAGGNGTDTLLGSPKNDSLTGGSGRDSIVGSDGDDTLAGGSGNDTLVGGNGRDSILASAGADSALGGAGLDTIFGGTGNDTLDGGEGNDIVNGQDNDDSLLGSAGVDKVAGGTGNDTLDGGTEADTVNGESGDDSLRGNDGDDLVTGGDGVDRLDGGNGNDRLRGESGNDTLLGGGGADNLFGGANDDSVDGGADNDSLFGDFGNDIVLGGDGDDQLRGFEGSDVLDGGGGSDRISEEADTNFVIIGLQLSSSFTGTETVLNIERFNLNGGSSHNLIDARRSSVKVILNGLDGNDTLLGSPFVDNIFGGNGDDVVSGGASNDVLDGGAGTDFLYEVANSDFTLTATQLISAATGTETPTGIERAALVGGTGNNRFDATTAAIPVILLGGSGNDTLIGGAFNDVLVGGSRADTTAGTDSLTGNAGADTLDGSNGDTRTIDAFDTVLADVLASIPSWIDAI